MHTYNQAISLIKRAEEIFKQKTKCIKLSFINNDPDIIVKIKEVVNNTTIKNIDCKLITYSNDINILKEFNINDISEINQVL